MTTSWIDHYAGEGGDMFALIMREQACDFGRVRFPSPAASRIPQNSRAHLIAFPVWTKAP
jgi:hypothetical protein